MKKILAFSGSNSSTSINSKLLEYTLGLITNHEINNVDIRDYDMPIYGLDLEAKDGIPQKAHSFAKLLADCDGIVFACPEYNGFMPTAMKNIIDWVSRTSRPIFQNKPMLIMSTSPGPRGGSWNLDNMAEGFSYRGAEIKGKFSLASFNDNFDSEKNVITNIHMDEELKKELNSFLEALN